MTCPNCGANLDVGFMEMFSSGARVVGNFKCGGCGHSIPANKAVERAATPRSGSLAELWDSTRSESSDTEASVAILITCAVLSAACFGTVYLWVTSGLWFWVLCVLGTFFLFLIALFLTTLTKEFRSRRNSKSASQKATAEEVRSEDTSGIESIVVKALSDDDYEIRKSASKELDKLNPILMQSQNTIWMLAPILLEALKDSKWDVRETAAKTLGMIADTRAIESLEASLKDENEVVRKAAAVALEKIAQKQRAED